MLSTENLTFYKPVNEEWIFEYYLNLSEKLIGQDIKILSVFNSKDKVPSMCIYVDPETMTYKFKDFSSGNQGNSVALVMYLYNITYKEALVKIQEDSKNSPLLERNFIHHEKFKVTNYEIRHWNNEDAKYWLQFKIDSKLLDKYNVSPLAFYEMSRNTPENRKESFKTSRLFTYGYFDKEGELIKIYQPKILDKKFILVKKHIQGYDQLTFKTKYLLIASSLKDIMSFNKLKISNIEAIAPDGENTMISKDIMQSLISKYYKIIILFDNDEPGKKSALKYKEVYNINNINLDLSKDLSDSVKEYGINTVRTEVIKQLKNKLL